MRLKQYLDESVETDKQFRKEANKAFKLWKDHFVKLAKKYGTVLDAVDKVGGYKKAMIVKLDKLGMPKYKRLTIKVEYNENSHYKGVYFLDKDELRIVFDDGEFDEFVEGNAKDVAKIMDSMKNAFIHEFIHVMDYRRADDPVGMHRNRSQGKLSDIVDVDAMSKSEIEDTEDIVSYYTQPNEFNAHFQAFAEDVHDMMKTDKYFAKNVLKSYKDFRKTIFLNDKYDKKFMHMRQLYEFTMASRNPKWKRKIDKRLRMFYDSIKEEFNNEI